VFEAVTIEKKKVAEEARIQKMEEQKEAAWEDAKTDGALYQKIADMLTARISDYDAQLVEANAATPIVQTEVDEI